MKKILLINIIIFLSCNSKHLNTIDICNGKVYIETFSNVLIDESKEFITDSSTYRYYVGGKDNEHEFFFYTCNSNLINIKLYQRDLDSFGNRLILKEWNLNLDSLKNVNH